MAEAFDAINSPIPNILIVAGLAFILLAFAGKLVGRIEIPPDRQKWVGIVGGILLIVGIGLYVANFITPTPAITPALTDTAVSSITPLPDDTPIPNDTPAPRPTNLPTSESRTGAMPTAPEPQESICSVNSTGRIITDVETTAAAFEISDCGTEKRRSAHKFNLGNRGRSIGSVDLTRVIIGNGSDAQFEIDKVYDSEGGEVRGFYPLRSDVKTLLPNYDTLCLRLGSEYYRLYLQWNVPPDVAVGVWFQKESEISLVDPSESCMNRIESRLAPV